MKRTAVDAGADGGGGGGGGLTAVSGVSSPSLTASSSSSILRPNSFLRRSVRSSRFGSGDVKESSSSVTLLCTERQKCSRLKTTATNWAIRQDLKVKVGYGGLVAQATIMTSIEQTH